jgi:hypothetical protein
MLKNIYSTNITFTKDLLTIKNFKKISTTKNLITTQSEKIRNRNNSKAESKKISKSNLNKLNKYNKTDYSIFIAKSESKSKNYSVPKLSHSLAELNPKSLITKEKFMELVKGANYQLTRGEVAQIFATIDTEKQDEISQQQFDNFKTLLIMPFEACDSTRSYLLGEAEFLACFQADPKWKLVHFRRRNLPDIYKKLSSIVSNRGDSKLNFFAFLFLKRALFAWTQCQTDQKYISLSGFKCAMETIAQLHRKILYEDLYKIALEYQFLDGALIAPDFVCFLNIAHKVFFFNIISFPNRNYLLEKRVFLKAIEEDRLPQNFSAEEVNLFYGLMDLQNSKGEVYEQLVTKPNAGAAEAPVAMDFRSFMFFINFHNLMNMYSVNKPMHLDKKELLRLLEDPRVPVKIINAIDHSLTRLDEQQHIEGSLVHGTKKVSEAQFFTKFLVKSEKIKTENSMKDKNAKRGKSERQGKEIKTSANSVIKEGVDNDYGFDENEKDEDSNYRDVEMGDEFDTKEDFVEDNNIQEEIEDDKEEEKLKGNILY